MARKTSPKPADKPPRSIVAAVKGIQYGPPASPPGSRLKGAGKPKGKGR